MRRTLTTLVVGATLALTGGVAHAATQDTTQVLVTMTGTSTTCDGTNAIIHATLHNPATADETAVVYLEPIAGGNTLGVPVTNVQPSPSPVTVPKGGHLDITLPYENGNAVFMAVAVAQGGTMPTTDQELVSQRNAGTAAFSEMFPADSTRTNKYPAAPAACTPPPQTACPPGWPINPYPIEDPACIPHTTTAATVTATVTATKKIYVPGPTVTKTNVKTVTSAVTSTVTTTAPGSTTTTTVTGGGPFPGAEATDSTTPVADARLAHTGASTVPLATVAVLLLLCGMAAFAGAYFMSRRRRSH